MRRGQSSPLLWDRNNTQEKRSLMRNSMQPRARSASLERAATLMVTGISLCLLWEKGERVVLARRAEP
ncbi:hypothetical protein MRB53_018273 [Persea americana]|uniref:Uncharacterized protein n=1 Tax=Persea americana TaxID=3435 RepID=A0ACC2M8C4_PERAE|nr:hypothetical protein MRB53_018273 [Persea americana]